MTRSADNWRALRNRALSGVFLVGLFLPGLAMLVTRAPATGGEGEPRRPFPVLRATWRSISHFPAGFYEYFEANYGFRQDLVRNHAAVKLHWLGVSPSAQVIVGTEGWLYYAGEGERDCTRHARPFRASELAAWEDVLEARRAWAEQHGMHFVFVIAPDKHTIYPEHLPRTMRAVRATSRFDQLAERLDTRHPQLAFVDPRGALREAKSRYALYYRYDTHWNNAGAFVATQGIAARLRTWLPKAPALGWDWVRPARSIAAQRDLARLVGMPSREARDGMVRLIPREGRHAVVVTGDTRALQDAGLIQDVFVMQRPGAPLPPAVVLRDSFGMSMLPYLSEQFTRTTYLWTDRFSTRALAHARPAIIIWEIAERRLMRPPPPALD